MKLIKDASINLGGQWILLFLSLAINISIARWFGPEGKGVYALLTTTATLTALAANWGLGRAAIFYIKNGKYELSEATSGLLTLSTVVSTGIGILLAVGLHLYGERIFDGVPITYTLAVVLLAPFLLGKINASNIFNATEEYAFVNLPTVLGAIITLGTLVLLANLDTQSNTIFLAVITGTVIPAILSWGLIVSKYGSVRLLINRHLYQDFLTYGLRSYSYTVLTHLNLRLDQFLIGLILNVQQVGIYSVAVAFSELSTKVAASVAQVLFPRIASLGKTDANNLSAQISRLTFLLSSIVCITLGVTGEFAIGLLFGEEFQRAFPSLLILLPGAIFFNLMQILYADLSGRGKPEIGSVAMVVGVSVTIVGNFMVTPIWGIKGAAAVATVAYIISFLIMLVLYSRETQQSMSRIILPNSKDLKLVLDRIYGFVQIKRS